VSVATDYYAELGVSRDASPEEIKKAYRRLARELHPDVNPDPAAQERFKAVTAAYEVLSDPDKRHMFDLGGDPLSASGGFGGFNAGFDFGDIMDAFFGGGQRRGPRTRARRGQDALIRLPIDLHAAVFGEEREIAVDTAERCETCAGAGTAANSEPEVCPMCQGRGEIQQVQRSFLGQVMTARPCPQCQGFGSTIRHPCPECAGDGRVRTRRTLTVAVPAGVDTGTRIQLGGQGEAGPNGGPAGDLYVEIVVRDHPIFERHGDDLHCTVSLPMTAAALGTTISIETMDGPEQIQVHPGTQGSEILTMKGKGVGHLRGGGRGDIHVHLVVQTPTNLSAEQTELMQQLAELRDEERISIRPMENNGGGGLFSRLKGAFTTK
jgi:molecular chaperone DnaJ